MDPLIHSAAGAFIGWALPRRYASLGAVPPVVAGALLPDVDYFTDPFIDPRSAFSHRGFTHSLFGVAVLAPLAALLVWRFSKKKRFTLPVVLIATGMLSHLLLDLPTPMGVMLFYPFSRKYVHLDFFGYLDWSLFTLALFVLLTIWTYANRNTAVRRGIYSATLLSLLSWWLYSEWPKQAFYFAATVEEATEAPFRTVYPLVLGGILLLLFVAFSRKDWGFRQSRAVFGRMGVAIFGAYLIFCVTLQGIVLSETQQFTRERGIVVWRRAASRMGYSSLVGPFLWTGLVLAPEGVYQAQIIPERRLERLGSCLEQQGSSSHSFLTRNAGSSLRNVARSICQFCVDWDELRAGNCGEQKQDGKSLQADARFLACSALLIGSDKRGLSEHLVATGAAKGHQRPPDDDSTEGIRRCERGIKLTLIRTVRGGGVIGTRVAFRGAFWPHEGIVLEETEDSVILEGGKERHAGQPRASDSRRSAWTAKPSATKRAISAPSALAVPW